MEEQQHRVIVSPVEDTESFLRNPGMGWAIYIDAFEKPFPQAEVYWRLQDPNIGLASILYIRVPWSELEPDEGCYAWVEDVNYRRLIQMALERGLKLSFRVYIDSKDAYRQATPQFVFDAGARGYVNENKGRPFQTPYVYDRVFQNKFSRFVRAFANEYDNPAIVDFIDAQGLGWWGEMHNMNYLWLHPQKKQVFKWIIHLYSSSFQNVLLGEQYGKGTFSYAMQDWALREKGYAIRRDSFGSPTWLSPKDKERIEGHWPSVPVFAENCYHTFVDRPEWYKGDGFATLREMMERVVLDAKELHANTLDLRIPEDAAQWMQVAPDLVRDFAIRGGYRFVLNQIAFPKKMKEGKEYVIHHSWKNTGVGKLPNSLKNWGYKYKVSFALLNPDTGNPVYQMLDRAEPSDWLKNFEYTYESLLCPRVVPPGTYHFAIAIVNTANNCEPEIKLAIGNERTDRLWYLLGNVEIRIGNADMSDARAKFLSLQKNNINDIITNLP